jgi:hypothetical protein
MRFFTRNNKIMRKNLGIVDRLLRTLTGLIILLMPFLHLGSYLTGAVTTAIGIFAILTALISICPVYLLFGWRSKLRRRPSYYF